jgi:hypothetical protein
MVLQVYLFVNVLTEEAAAGTGVRLSDGERKSVVE